MGSVYIILQMFFYYPSFILLFYIYIVFIIPLRSRLSIRFSIKSFLENNYLRLINFLMNRNNEKG
uniref:ATP synthase F0 subunit 8 n=1 Tax=Callistopteris apiifolia TaxID=221309 RepID=A0A385KNY6_9MONI|nr:hypothetical protein [Callistopteris apiifolia]